MQNHIRHNARTGKGLCSNCSACKSGGSKLVNPGLFDPTSEIVFITEEPRHLVDWSNYNNWSDYNAEWADRIANARGGQFISELLDPFDISIYDTWVTDSIKCPTKGDEDLGIPSADTRDAAEQCQPYLQEEIKGGRSLIITLGAPAAKRTHQALGIEPPKASSIRIKRDYGRSGFETEPPIVISPHWNAWITRDDFVPIVQEAMAEVLYCRS